MTPVGSGPEPALLRVVQVMDRLRSPGGCPWDAAQTHESLAPYLLEETYEVLEAIDTADSTLLREELGDVLLQVLFHARLAQDEPEPFSIDDVAADLEAKLIRRHPHVFGDADTSNGTASTADQVNENWERLKAVEKQRDSVTDGVPLAQPALALAAKLIARTRRAGLTVTLPAPRDPGEQIAARLFELVGQAVEAGIDPEAALRAHTSAFRQTILAAEAQPH